MRALIGGVCGGMRLIIHEADCTFHSYHFALVLMLLLLGHNFVVYATTEKYYDKLIICYFKEVD